jgi:pimeloyl-ACP methyl ester carboxylesterase
MSAAQAEFWEDNVFANGVNLHYHRATPPVKKSLLGRSRPTLTVILLHGVTDNGMCWIRVANALYKDYDVIMPDSRGHGLSDAPETGYGVDDRAADVAGLIDQLNLDRPVLFGHSMGAETAIGTAALFPEKIRGVILEDPPWPGRFWGSTPEEKAERVALMRDEILQNAQKSVQDLTAQAHTENPLWHADELAPWAESKQQVSPSIATRVLAPRRRWSDYVRQAQCPILLITGDPDRGSLVTPATAEEAAQYWKNGRVVHVPNAGHSIHRDQFDPVVQAARDFLSKMS